MIADMFGFESALLFWILVYGVGGTIFYLISKLFNKFMDGPD